MQRHVSDSFATLSATAPSYSASGSGMSAAAAVSAGGGLALPYFPSRPSRLNPAQRGRRGSVPTAIHGRGTVSMPTSPLRRAAGLPWTDSHSSQAFFGWSGAADGEGDGLLDPTSFSLPPASISDEPQTSRALTGEGVLFSPVGLGTAATVDGSGDWAMDHDDPFHVAPPDAGPIGGSDAASAGDLASEHVSPHSPFPLGSIDSQPLVSGFGSLGDLRRGGAHTENGQQGNNDHTFHEDGGVSVRTGQVRRWEADGVDIQRGTGFPADPHGRVGVGGGPARKKRQQVRVACTHCQKACKKCSNTRPCERCVKYGLTDCVDSTRKPRKTGVKRGPYKRRPSAKFASNPAYDARYDSATSPFRADSFGDDSSPRSAHSNISMEYAGAPHPHAYPHSGYHQQYSGRYGLSDPSGGYPFNTAHPTQIEHSMHAHANHSFTAQPPSPTLPGPRPSRLESALTAALAGATSGPRWVDGTRVPGSGEDMTAPLGAAGVLMPHTPTVPFPLSLNAGADRHGALLAAGLTGAGVGAGGGSVLHAPGAVAGAGALGGRQGRGGMDDPFSRAVSPIRTKHQLNPAGLDARGQQTLLDLNARLEQHLRSAQMGLDGGKVPSVQGHARSQHPAGEMIGTPMNEGIGAILGPQSIQAPLSAASTTRAYYHHHHTFAQNGNADHIMSIDPRILSAPSTPIPDSSEHRAPWTQTSAPTSPAPDPHPLHLHLHQPTRAHPAATTATPAQISVATIALKRIRRPSLRTLMVPGISREGTPVVLPVPQASGQMYDFGQAVQSGNAVPGGLRGRGGVWGGAESPTLFQGEEMGFDDDGMIDATGPGRS